MTLISELEQQLANAQSLTEQLLAQRSDRAKAMRDAAEEARGQLEVVRDSVNGVLTEIEEAASFVSRLFGMADSVIDRADDNPPDLSLQPAPAVTQDADDPAPGYDPADPDAGTDADGFPVANG